MHYNIVWIYLLITEFEETVIPLHIKWTTHRAVIHFYKVTDINLFYQNYYEIFSLDEFEPICIQVQV